MTDAPARTFAISARLGWWMLLGAAALAGTFGFDCAIPFAALAALAAVHLSRRDAVLLLGASWIINQGVGFGLLHYPLDHVAAVGAGQLAVAAAASIAAALILCALLRGSKSLPAVLATFVAAFLAYEGSLYLVSGPAYAADYTWPVIRFVAELNVFSLAALLVAHRLGVVLHAMAPRTAVARLGNWQAR